VTEAFVALSAPSGVRLAALGVGLSGLLNLPQTGAVAVSRAYEAEDGDGRPAVAVARLETGLNAEQLSGYLGDIQRTGAAGVPGGADLRLELVMFGDEEWVTDELRLPLPGFDELDRVVTPLLELAPDARYPDGTRIDASRVRRAFVVGDLGTVPGAETLRPVIADGISDLDAAIRAEGRKAGSPAPPPAEPELQPGDEWAVLFSVPDTASWTSIRVTEGLLRSAGIPTRQEGTLVGERLAFGVPSGATVRLLVPKSRVHEAHTMLAEARPLSEDMAPIEAAATPYDGEGSTARTFVIWRWVARIVFVAWLVEWAMRTRNGG
jgi:2-amino-4-hydroxy-6-hydroxymethyldihydropteridine diphosphokinase